MSMEKKQNNSFHLGACEKFFKAITIRPAFRRICSISKHPQHPNPATPPSIPHHSKPLQGLKTPQNRDAAEVIPITFDNNSSLPPPRKEAISQIIPAEKVQTKPNAMTDMTQPRKTLVPSSGQVAKVPSKIEPEPHVVLSSQQKEFGNDGQRHGQGGKTGAKVEKEEDKYNDYIKRAKLKIRTTTNVGDHVKNEDHSKDQFSDYINRAKLKIRSMSTFK